MLSKPRLWMIPPKLILKSRIWTEKRLDKLREKIWARGGPEKAIEFWEITEFQQWLEEKGWLKGTAIQYLMSGAQEGSCAKRVLDAQVRFGVMRYDWAQGETKLPRLVSVAEDTHQHGEKIWWGKARPWKRLKDFWVRIQVHHELRKQMIA